MSLRHKFFAKPTELDGIRFASKGESRYYSLLKLRQASGEVVGFLRQVPFHLTGSVRYVCDFQEFHADGTVHFIDVKGMETPAFRSKMRQMKVLYPWVTIEVVQV